MRAKGALRQPCKFVLPLLLWAAVWCGCGRRSVDVGEQGGSICTTPAAACTDGAHPDAAVEAGRGDRVETAPDGDPDASVFGQALELPKAPEGYYPMTVMEVAPTARGEAVLLIDDAGEMVLPIVVGGTEALSIRLRLEGSRFSRPLTHDLLDAVTKTLGGAVRAAQVDELRGHTFVGSVLVQQGGKVHKMDARPSDAIALALGNGVPIFVSRKVVNAAGLSKKELEERSRGKVLQIDKGGSDPIAL